MGWFQRNASGRNKYDEIVKREERTIGTTRERTYGQNQPAKDPVVIDRGPAKRGEQTIGGVAELMAGLQKLCPECQLIVAALLKVAKSEPSGSVPVHKADQYGGNLGTQRTPEARAQPVNVNNFLGIGSNAGESPQKVALRKRESARIATACKALFKL